MAIGTTPIPGEFGWVDENVAGQSSQAARDIFYRERDAILASLARGENPYGGMENAINSIYQTYGQNSGISYQEAAGIIGQAYQAGDDPVKRTTQSTGPTREELDAMLVEHKQRKNQIEQAYQDGLIDWKTKNASLEDERNNLIGQKDQGLASNSAYFENISPDAYQSQNQNYNNKVLDAYTQGEKTIQNNQEAIDYYKQQTENNYDSNMDYMNSYNEGTGKYNSGAYVAPAVVKAPTINAVTQNPYSQAAKLGVPAWAPNYGGQSVNKAKAANDDPIKKYLG